MDLTELTRMYDFTSRSIVVTGATGVLCSKMVQALVGCGAHVAVLTRSEEKGHSLLRLLSGPGRAIVVRADVLIKEDLQEAARKVLQEFGKVDGLVNGAGGNSPQATTRQDLSFFDLPEEALRYVFDLNLLGVILPSQVFGKHMANQTEGVILNVSR